MKDLKKANKVSNENLSGYPASPAGEDIYNKYLEEKDIDPENVAATKDLNVIVQDDSNNETSDVSGSDLDVPGSELDDKMEAIGSEDEENNYYSLGGDDHNDLDEDKGI